MTDTRKLVDLICQRVAAGQLDLRDVGLLLTGAWDQDAPAALLAAAARTGQTDEAMKALIAASNDILNHLPNGMTINGNAARTYALEHARDVATDLLSEQLPLR